MVQIATPPIFDTDIPTSEQFYTKAIAGYTTIPGGTVIPPPAHNFNKRYAQGAIGVVSMDNAPLGHGAQHQGIWAMVMTADNSYGGDYAVRMAFHPQSGVVTDYQKGWTVKDPAIVSPVENVYAWSHWSYGICASQRLGDYVYGIAYAGLIIGSGSDPIFHLPTRYDQVGEYKIIKVGPSQAITTVVDVTVNSTGQDFATSGQSTCPLIGVGPNQQGGLGNRGHRTEMFVSDDATPFIWHTTGDIQNDWNANYDGGTVPNAQSMAWTENGSAPGTMRGRTDGKRMLTGQVGGYLQYHRLPPNSYGFGPYLVFPWASGNYGPPEMWYFMFPDGNNGSTFDIYRSVWGRGHYKRESTFILTDDTAFNNNTRQFPAANPEGWAFDQNWYLPRNKVGRIGPFPGAEVYNRNGGGSTSSTISYPYFKVMRDRKRVGQMHTVFGDGKPVSGSLTE